MIPPDATAEEIEVLLREGLTATDFQGNDITDLVTWTHDIDSAVPGGYTVTYTVTDQWGNTAVKQVEALVGTDWMKYPTCNGWVLGGILDIMTHIRFFTVSVIRHGQIQRRQPQRVSAWF